MILSPRRLAWIYASADAGSQLAPKLPGTVVPCSSVTTLAGASTNADELYLVVKGMVRLFAGPVRIEVFPEVGSGTLTARARSLQYLVTALLQPTALGKLSGRGLVSPTFA